MNLTDRTFANAIARTRQLFLTQAVPVHPKKWQGIDVSNRREMKSHELLDYELKVLMPSQSLEHYRKDIGPNLPWADNHFLERVCGEPINPGIEWANWPWGDSAKKFIEDGGQFNHNYMERYWPKYAGNTPDEHGRHNAYGASPLEGIRHTYGDLNDVIELLLQDPLTRQAWLPIFFPEDTGVGDGGRKPCTLGYQFIRRDDRLHIYYPLRSCDFIRHFRDDIYLTVRLLLWMIERLADRDPANWAYVTPGVYSMHCTSLHVFENDLHALRSA